MKKVTILGLMFAALIAFQGVANAKTVSGKITGVDAATNKLSISTVDPATGSASTVDISVDAKTAYAGAAALVDLTAGQEVSIEAEEAAGVWTASSVKVAEPALEAPAATETAAEPAQ